MTTSHRIKTKKTPSVYQEASSLALSVFIHSLVFILVFFSPFEEETKKVKPHSYSVTIIEEKPKPKKKIRKPTPVKKKKKVKKKVVKQVPPKPNPKLKKKKVKKVPPKPEVKKEKVSPPPEKEVEEEIIIETPESMDVEDDYSPDEPMDMTPESDEVPMKMETPENLSISTGKNLNVSTGGTDFPYPWYLVSVKNKINGNWAPSDIMVLRGKILKVIVAFRIHKDGKVSKVIIENPSNLPLYDNSTVRAIYSSAPLPPFPEGFNSKYLDIHFEFEYHKMKKPE